MLIITINDITNYRFIQKELIEKDRILSESQKIARIGSFEVDLILGDWKISNQFNDIFGIDEGYSHNLRGWVKLIHPAFRKKMGEYLKFTIENKKKLDCEYKIVRISNKEVKWVHLIGELILSAAGTPLKLVGTVQDITERKDLDGALIESEARNNSMLANVADVIAIIDIEGTITYISPNCTNVFSMFPESIIGTKAWSTIYPEDVERMKNEMESLVSTKAIKKVVEYRHQHSNGKISDIELTAINMLDDPNISGILVTYHNITEKKVWEREIIYLNHHDTLTGLYNRFFFDEETRRLDKKRQLPISIIMGDINGLKLINDAFGHTEGDNLLVNVANILKRSLREEDILARVGGDEFAVILPKTSEETVEKIVNSIYLNCKENRSKEVTELDFTSISLGSSTKKNIEKSIELVREEAEIEMYKRKLLESKSIHSSIMSTIKTSMLEKSHNTQEHAERLVNLSASVGRELGLNSSQLNDLELLATLHDLGKMGIDKELLDKPSSLNNEEKAEMKRHPEIGYRIAKSSPDLIQLSDMILAHHEFWDGTGYPQGLKGEEIPLLSRIIAIVDAYDAMTSDRAYRTAIPKKDAIAEINRCKGKQFDPTIADIFINILCLES
jgi:diguanylate cyclase (GGDEF)-like protein/PAS domain S-box-containing protein